jgi:hypothetical protein
MDSSYVQRASLSGATNNKHKYTFTNLSSQEMNPGTLAQFYSSQNAAVQPMPYTHDDINVPEQHLRADLSESRNNVSETSRKQSADIFFRENTRTTKTDFRTPSQQAWNVPLSQTEVRATEMF